MDDKNDKNERYIKYFIGLDIFPQDLLEDMRYNFSQALEQSPWSPIKIDHVERGGKNPGQDTSGALLSCLPIKSKIQSMLTQHLTSYERVYCKSTPA